MLKKNFVTYMEIRVRYFMLRDIHLNNSHTSQSISIEETPSNIRSQN